MDVNLNVFSAMVAIVGIVVAWRFRKNENGRVRGSAWVVIVGGIVLLVGLLWQWIRG